MSKPRCIECGKFADYDKPLRCSECYVETLKKREHKHKPRVIGMDTLTYRKGTIICSSCGMKLKDPINEVLQ